VVGHANRGAHIAKWNVCFDAVICGISLAQALKMQKYNMVIPVGGRSVLTVADTCPELSLLPSRSQLEVCFDKQLSLQLARRLGVPAPQSLCVYRVEELNRISMPFPCVVKPAREASRIKTVEYCHNRDELTRAVTSQMQQLAGESGVLVQEYVPGCGYGLFALMENGSPLRVFMHQRLREFPPSGGRSTAARAFYSADLKHLGLSLLSALNWRGVAMVEFKRNPATDEFVLLEINPKFWGSLELALSAGVNFGADLIRLFRGQRLDYHEDYDRTHEFYWPLDDDIFTLWQTRSLRHIRDYWNADAHTNLFQSLRVDAYKSLRLMKQVLLG
jgi:predicted ATP-grasp superfamily ATP-dependent carboligase